jgi:hypothetical protein
MSPWENPTKLFFVPNFYIYIYIFFTVVLGEGTLWHLQKSLQYIKYNHTWIHPLHHSSLPPHSWNSFNRYHFSIYIHMFTVFSLYSHSFVIFPHHTHQYQPLQTGPVLPSCSPILYKEKRRRKWHFCLFKRATQGVSLWHFHVYIYIYMYIL